MSRRMEHPPPHTSGRPLVTTLMPAITQAVLAILAERH